APFENQPRHQMFGYCSPVQNAEMDVECQLASNGLYLGDATGYNDPRAPELKKNAHDWKSSSNSIRTTTPNGCGATSACYIFGYENPTPKLKTSAKSG
ncbi:hypothetical protein MLD52_21320, partial [Puniceicoccaceae bacterium K14]|nr:hypothetical protein [Puniceicoccaceae bacterium K14]